MDPTAPQVDQPQVDDEVPEPVKRRRAKAIESNGAKDVPEALVESTADHGKQRPYTEVLPNGTVVTYP